MLLQHGVEFIGGGALTLVDVTDRRHTGMAEHVANAETPSGGPG